jgi:cytochrome c-type biogenesis protein CcmH/NrfG
MLVEMNRPAEAERQFAKALKRTPTRPMAIYGLARSAEMQGDNRTAATQYEQFLLVWKNADPALPEVSRARQFVTSARAKTH